MTELIVALDGPEPVELATRLHGEVGVRWFKVGPQMMTHGDWLFFLDDVLRRAVVGEDVNVFLDLKLADTRDTVREAVKRFADAGIAAVSTSTDEATRAAIEADTNVRVWQLHHLTDQGSSFRPRLVNAHGVICPGDIVERYVGSNVISIVVPGVRLDDEGHGHLHVSDPRHLAFQGATHAVVGRPIWMAKDPVAAARRYVEALKGEDA